MITYDYYRIFYYVAQYKSFTRAAEALHNNQPNITRRLPMSSCRLGKMRSVRIGISKMDWFPSEPAKMRYACGCFRC